MKLNWKLIAMDLVTLGFIVLAMIAWETAKPFSQFGYVVIGVSSILFRLDDHYQLYKKERRFY